MSSCSQGWMWISWRSYPHQLPEGGQKGGSLENERANRFASNTIFCHNGMPINSFVFGILQLWKRWWSLSKPQSAKNFLSKIRFGIWILYRLENLHSLPIVIEYPSLSWPILDFSLLKNQSVLPFGREMIPAFDILILDLIDYYSTLSCSSS